ncbi:MULTISPECIES: MBL fold metallo-hydrolase [unclassified Nodularia (in: cyanobacteria)]|uniref:MBL fold metallo-hydrolase n=1 Tax=unclassified Nodularia (in: cyanobacteria) TaxID=2656917 RepID=UPI00188155FB|nr:MULTISPECIES: MBL fold metallo-hydrolase [unclassified Nodularia (in: cyanobacteria)]MBE9201171.1 MBL fold metallo-hydrolase [Nodularia sp. LEGE 06071]MCC2693720.1 MBL fold metallo-hydrolase [Nodularia sp. LEGE 04288]
MKSLHRPDLYGWSTFNPARNIDFNGIAWVRPDGNVLVDPVALSNHDWNHLKSLGGVVWIVLTNSEHVRSAKEIADQTYAKIAGPVGEKDYFPIRCDRWLADGDEVVPGLQVLELQGSKTPGELALLLEETTLITGDLVRARKAGSLTILPDEKLLNRKAAVASVQRLAALPHVEAVLVGDGWPVFRDGRDRLQELLETL